MYYIKGNEPKIQINLLKVLQSINTNDYATLKLLLDNFVKSYGVLTNESCLLQNELKVEATDNADKITIKKGTAIFPINAYFLVDGENTNVDREIIVICNLKNDRILQAPQSVGNYYVILTADKEYFNEIIGQKPYTNPIENNIKAIYELKPKIELISTNTQEYLLEQNTSLIRKNGKRYGFCLAEIRVISNIAE